MYDDDDDWDYDDEDTEPAGGADERARSFPAFGPGKRIGRKFADTWWGNAWIEAMERTALDAEQLIRARKYAFAGQVGPITVSPGRISTAVHDGDPEDAHDTVVRLATLTDAEWDRLLDRVAAKAGHIAALLDRDMPPDLVATADDAGVRLLPDHGDLDPECECPSWDRPCRHAAALAYQTAWLLDRDPFVLLLIRGRAEAEIIEELRHRNAKRDISQAGAVEQAGVPAAQAYATTPGPLPEPALPVTGEPMALAPLLGAAPGIDAEALGVLAADAAGRARQLLCDGDGAPQYDHWQDAVRLAVRMPRASARRLAEATGRPEDLPRAVKAWEYAAEAGVDVLDAVWTPSKDIVARGSRELGEAWQDSGREGEPKAWRNRWTMPGGDLQVRYGRDGRWYPFRRRSGDWWPAGGPSPDPVTTVFDLLRD